MNSKKGLFFCFWKVYEDSSVCKLFHSVSVCFVLFCSALCSDVLQI